MGTAIKFTEASTAGRKLVQGYLDGSADEVYIIYAEFLSMAKQIPVLKKLLPHPAHSKKRRRGNSGSRLSARTYLRAVRGRTAREMLPRNVYVQVYSALLETSASEHAARMMAHGQCHQSLQRHDRQSHPGLQQGPAVGHHRAELMDIVGGAEALKG